jgi:hypothetical protein
MVVNLWRDVMWGFLLAGIPAWARGSCDCTKVSVDMDKGIDDTIVQLRQLATSAAMSGSKQQAGTYE